MLSSDWDVGLGGVGLDGALFGGMMDCGCCIGTEECLSLFMRLPKPPRRPWDLLLPLVMGMPALCPATLLNGLDLVFLCAFFSRSSIFCLNFFASLSDAKHSAAMQFSSSKL